MKILIAAILAMCALCGISRADHILIYSGAESTKANDSAAKILHFYWLFDLTTLQYVGVEFGGTGSGKFYSVSGSASFVYSPVNAQNGKTRTYFAFGSSNMNSPFALDFGFFTGVNSEINLSNNPTAPFTGQFPAILGSRSYALAGDGTLTDTAVVDAGSFHLHHALTRQSNGDQDNLAAATTIVTDLLAHDGYGAE